MIDREKLQDVLAAYKRDFDAFQWKREKYKWEAVKCFQDHWDINAPDFVGMLTQSTAKTSNLLAATNNYPLGMIKYFAQQAPEEVRAMFLALFDESRDVYERIEAFKAQSAVMLDKYDAVKQHYQQENAISVYLWLRYPDKYYIFKLSEVKKAAAELDSSRRFKKGAYEENIRSFYHFYDELCAELQKDEELKALLQSHLTDTCWPDPALRTLTIDVGFYISRFYSERQQESPDGDDELSEIDPVLFSEDWYPSAEEYTPGISKEQWLGLLNNKEIIDVDTASGDSVWGGVLAAFYEAGGAATCKQIAGKYHVPPSRIIGNCTQLAKRIHRKTQCPLLDEENAKYWPILFLGKRAGPDVDGGYIWKLRPELFEALSEFDIMRYRWKTEGEELADNGEAHYWWLNANPKKWSWSSTAVGESQSYTLYNENGNRRRVFQNFLDAKAGDMLIGYETTPAKQIVALGRITQGQDGERIWFEKTEGLASPIDYQTLRECPELEQMEYFQNPQGSLFRLTRSEYDFILDLIREENPLPTVPKTVNAYTKDDFLEEVFLSEERYDTLAAVLHNKMNVILQGAPGVGKTYAARRLAWAMMGEKDDSRIEMVQFHQNYSYEDFVMGYRPAGDGFDLKYGIFYRFCQKAANQPNKEHFFIIDEINRGNLSRIFGELLMLIEKDYRGTKTTLAYNGLPFSVPDNLYIIGMMNTADRSLAMIDYALRRRFSFFEMGPGFDSEGFIRYQQHLNDETFNELIARVKELNRAIAADKSLGRGFCIGHSYFCGQDVCTEQWLRSVVEYDILPMLSEYWFDEPARLAAWENSLRGVFQ